MKLESDPISADPICPFQRRGSGWDSGRAGAKYDILVYYIILYYDILYYMYIYIYIYAHNYCLIYNIITFSPEDNSAGEPGRADGSPLRGNV